MAAGDLPIGAVVAMGGDIVGRSWAQERSQGRRLVHADLLAMEQADRRLGWTRRPAPVLLAINLEPCLMCLGAAMALGVTEIYYGLESPSDGAAGIAAIWRPAGPPMPFSRVPALTGGLHRRRRRAQFARYAQTAPESGFRTWAAALAGLPGEAPS
jgi:tRNA(adenine34) deaminase